MIPLHFPLAYLLSNCGNELSGGPLQFLLKCVSQQPRVGNCGARELGEAGAQANAN